MLRNIHIHTHDTVLEIQLCHSFSRVFDHAYYMCVFLCVSPCVCSCVHVCVLWSGRQCSILISREEPISCLACSLNVTGDFSVPGQKPHPHLSESRWDMWWSPSRDFCHYFIHLASTSADTNLVSCPHLGSFSSVSLWTQRLSIREEVQHVLYYVHLNNSSPGDYGFCIFGGVL